MGPSHPAQGALGFGWTAARRGLGPFGGRPGCSEPLILFSPPSPPPALPRPRYFCFVDFEMTAKPSIVADFGMTVKPTTFAGLK